LPELGKNKPVKSGASFLLGLTVGLTAGLLIHRIREIEDDPERVVDRLSDSLKELEERAKQLETRISPN